jgi:hypothetical protein
VRGAQAVLRHGATENGRLALGALIGFTAIAVHSFVDFGLHVSAVALFTAVVAAMLANLAELPATATYPVQATDQSSAWSGLAALVQAVALVAVAFLLVGHGRTEEQAERFRLAAMKAHDDRREEYLRGALAFAPDRTDLHLALADALVKRWRGKYEIQRLAAVTLVVGTPTSNLPAAALIGPAPHGWQAETDIQQARQLITKARRLSPLDLDALEKESRLAELFGDPTGKDKAMAQLRQLSPSEPAPWFWAGQRLLQQGDKEAACRAWRNALARSNRFLPQVIKAVPEHLSPKELLEKVLPNKPALIVQTLDEVPAIWSNEEERTRYLSAALAALKTKGDQLDAEENLLAARIHARRDDVTDACAAYELALAKQPKLAWRIEFCEYLLQARLYPRARQEVLLLVDQEAHNPRVRALQQEVYRKIAETQ